MNRRAFLKLLPVIATVPVMVAALSLKEKPRVAKKVWLDLEMLTAADLNAEFANVYRHFGFK